MTGSSPPAAASPAAIHCAEDVVVRRAVVNRLPPPCDIASVGFSSIRLLAGSTGDSTRRAVAWRVRTRVGIGVVAAQRQLEPALAGQRAVARTRVAADPREIGIDMVAEAPAGTRRGALDFDHGRRCRSPSAIVMHRLAVAYRGDHASAIDGRDLRVRRDERAVRGEVADEASPASRLDEQQLLTPCPRRTIASAGGYAVAIAAVARGDAAVTAS